MGDILNALGQVFALENILVLVFGTGVGIAIGAMPGLSVNMGIALLFPLTFAFQGVGGLFDASCSATGKSCSAVF
jgi:putative tricarboxylic transport membrane protein